jgi:hypothetical protein
MSGEHARAARQHCPTQSPSLSLLLLPLPLSVLPLPLSVLPLPLPVLPLPLSELPLPLPMLSVPLPVLCGAHAVIALCFSCWTWNTALRAK